MTRAEVLTWLESRRPESPAALARHLTGCVRDEGAEPLPGYLAGIGCELLRRVTANPGGGRELALDLLAADAFVTYAFEAQADADPAGLAALAGRVEREVSAA